MSGRFRSRPRRVRLPDLRVGGGVAFAQQVFKQRDGLRKLVIQYEGDGVDVGELGLTGGRERQKAADGGEILGRGESARANAAVAS